MNKRFVVLVFLVIVFGALLRFHNIDWDQGNHLHPDERAIIMFALPLNFPGSISQLLNPESSLNPRFFAYGNFPLYILKSSSTVASLFNPRFGTYDGIELVGRFLSAFADLVTIFLIVRLGKILFGDKVGIFAGFIYASSVLAIQSSHFFTVDIILTLFVTLTLLRLVRFYKNPTFMNAGFVGVSFGLALATKISAIPLIAAIGTAIILDFILIFLKSPHKPKNWLPHLPPVIKRLFKDGTLIGIFTVIVFVIAQPYALIDWHEFLSQNLLQSQMTKSAYTFPYTLQYVGKVPFIYELKNIFLWGLGPITALLCFLGFFNFIINIRRLTREAKSEGLILFAFFFVYLFIVSKFAVGWMRYLLPIYPIFAIFGAYFLVSKIFEPIKKIRNNTLQLLVSAILPLLIIIWPLSFISIYNKANTRVAASNWIIKNIPAGKTLAVEHWDDRLPLYNSQIYNVNELALYDQPDDSTKWGLMWQKINSSDYIIIASNRLYVPIQRLDNCQKYKTCYPIASKYYSDLFGGKLGFKEIAEFTNFPNIPFTPMEIDDQKADESFTVYDHPKVMIFKKD